MKKATTMTGLLPLQATPPTPTSRRHRLNVFAYAVGIQLLLWLLYNRAYWTIGPNEAAKRPQFDSTPEVLAHRHNLTERCKTIRTPAGPPPSFDPTSRLLGYSDRFVEGTAPVLIRNGKIWTGRKNGTEVIRGDVLLDRGLIIDVGQIPKNRTRGMHGLKVLNAKGKWITPGLVDLHSHLAVDSSPHLNGAADGNSRKAPILPWLRSIDGINTHDAAFQLSISGGVTTAQILPGSANNIGGQAFVIKLRPTAEKSTISKVLEPPETLIRSSANVTHVRWRHMKHACGENPDRVYSQTRMDAAWNFRQAYQQANQIKVSQDAFCDAVEAENWSAVDGKDIPEDYQWESLVDVLRGKVKLSIHCYEVVDLDMIIRLSNEFHFPIASFHHAGETYLVPDLLKKTWGGAPTVALFASNFRKKREAYRGSEFAPRILASHDIPVVMKSDHPVLNSRYLLFEAQQAHYYGLDTALALSSVTSIPAKAAGLDHRVGFISKGYDADVVIWDSHPLVLGATPTQVLIDGIAQLEDPCIQSKSRHLQRVPKTPTFDREAREAVEFDGLPPLHRRRRIFEKEVVKFTNVSYVWSEDEDKEYDPGFAIPKSVFVQGGAVVCISPSGEACKELDTTVFEVAEEVDLQGGSLLPGLISFGSPIGLDEISLEPSTNDGPVPDALTGSVPSTLDGSNAVIRAVDGLAFQGRNLLLAYRNGVTRAITAPSGDGFLQGLSTEFFTGAENALEHRAVIEDEVALHITISHNLGISVSTQITALRRLLSESNTTAWRRVRNRESPLVVRVDNADIMSTLLRLKAKFHQESGGQFDMTFSGASEAHLIAHEIANAGVSVILTMPRPFPGTWESQRILPGAPLTRNNAVMKLLDAGVNVGLGVVDGYATRNTRFEAAWVVLNSFGKLGKKRALTLVTSNIEHAFRLNHQRRFPPELVAYRGSGWFDFESKVVGVISPDRGATDLF